MRPICCSETSVRNYHFSLRNNSEERSSQFALEFLPVHELFLLMQLIIEYSRTHRFMNLIFIGPCFIVIVEEQKTNLMSLAVFISLLMRSTCFGHKK